MYSHLFPITNICFVVLVIGIVYAILFGLRTAHKNMGTDKIRSEMIIRYVLLGILFWLAAIGVLAHLGFFENFEALPPRILVAVIPPVILIFILLKSKVFSQVLAHIPKEWLVYIQSFRIVMEVILWMGMLAGFVPFQMTFTGFNYDIIVGVTAILGGMVFFGKGRLRRFEAIIWNIFGILLLLFIVGIAAVSTPGPFQIFTNEPANRMIAYVPFVWLPGFVVPFALAMHLFSLKQLLKKNPF